MTPYLLDVNILLNLVWEDLQNHALVKRWFVANGQHSFATCPLTQSGLVRISSSPRVLPKPASMRVALTILTQLTQSAGHAFWPLDRSLQQATVFCSDKLFGPGQLTDAYLLDLAITRGGTLVTLDQGIVQLAGATYANHVLLLQ